MVVALDTYSVAFPAVLAAMLFRKKLVLRVGGDFLWEQYLERVKKPKLSAKERQKRVSQGMKLAWARKKAGK